MVALYHKQGDLSIVNLIPSQDFILLDWEKIVNADGAVKHIIILNHIRSSMIALVFFLDWDYLIFYE